MEKKCLKAFKDGTEENCRLLLAKVEHPSKVREKDSSYTLLHYAAKRGMLDIVKLLVTKYHCNVMSQNAFGYTPVLLATMSRHLDIVKYLSKCNPDCLDISTLNDEDVIRTPLSEANDCGYTEIAEFIANELESKTCEYISSF